jgi:hypothetical protein
MKKSHSVFAGGHYETFSHRSKIIGHGSTFTFNGMHECTPALPANPWRPGAPNDNWYRAERNKVKNNPGAF